MEIVPSSAPFHSQILVVEFPGPNRPHEFLVYDWLYLESGFFPDGEISEGLSSFERGALFKGTMIWQCFE